MCGPYHRLEAYRSKRSGCCSENYRGYGSNKNYISKEKEVEELESYKEKLKKEQRDIEARIKDLKNG